MADRDPVSDPAARAPELDSTDDFIPPMPSRIIIRTKSSTLLTTSDSSRIPHSRFRNSTTWSRGISIGLTSLAGNSGISETWSEPQGGLANFIPIASTSSLRNHERSLESNISRSGSKKRPASLIATDGSVASVPPPISSAVDPFKRLRKTKILSEEWRHSPSLARPAVIEQNLASLLLQREIPGIFGKNPISLRSFYTVITPNYTVLDVQHPTLYLRKFSPDGRFFVGFSAELQVVHIFRYRGIGRVGQFFHQGTSQADYFSQHVVQRDIFRTLLREEFRVRVVPNDYLPHTISRDFSLFTEDSKFLLIVTSGASDLVEEDGPEIRQSNESLPLCAKNPLDDYKFYLISLATGEISDQREFKVDKIPIHHSAGIYLQGNLLWILSTQHQQIHVFEIVDGKFVPQRTLGQYCFRETGTTLLQWTTIFAHVPPAEEVFMGTLRQKLFMELLRIAQKDAKSTGSYGPIMEFHRLYTFYKRLKMWKFQLLEGNKLMIKWAPEDVVTGKASDPSNYPQFFTFFDVAECRFYGVYDHREGSMLRIFEKFHDDFRNAAAQHPHFQCDSFYSRVAYDRLKRLSMTAKNNNGPNDSCSRLLSMLPIPCQSFTPSPYVDMSLFQYDTSLISNSERVKAKVEEPIRFYSRDTGTLNFTMQVSKVPGSRRSKRVMSQIFHPFDPLIITYEKQNVAAVESDVHFHVWKSP